jgi:hypothetical protein
MCLLHFLYLGIYALEYELKGEIYKKKEGRDKDK